MEKIIVEILGGVLLTLTIGLTLFSFGSSFYFKFSLYFLRLKLENHPLLIQKVEKVLNDICTAENIAVFHVPYEVLNEGVNEPKSKAIGRYVYSTDLEKTLKTIEEIKADMRAMELKHGKPYNTLCIEAGLTPPDEKRLHMPRILLTGEMEKYGGLEYYFGTYFHELGHHFVVKNIGATVDHTEEDADKYAAELVKNHLPHYFLFFFSFAYRFKLTGISLTKKEKIKAFIEFLGYLKEKRKFDKNLKNE